MCTIKVCFSGNTFVGGFAFYFHVESMGMTASFSQREEVWDNKSSLTPTLCFIKVHVPSQESDRSFICMLGVSILLFLRFLIFIFWNCSDSLVCFVFHL